ncbi:MAG TPA: ThuA domain-containing protein [Candidatus Udaeobacter sp.]|nr:ThuA domain-containing protein [Candidatus Udaeobacter sp.]
MFRVSIGNRLFYEKKPIQVTIWNEYVQERTEPEVARVYPKGIHRAIAEGLAPYGFKIRIATLDEKEHGLTVDVLNQTDVLIWWGHKAHDKVKDEVVDRVYTRVLQGMGLIVLHSASESVCFYWFAFRNSDGVTPYNIQNRATLLLAGLFFAVSSEIVRRHLDNKVIPALTIGLYSWLFLNSRLSLS